MEEEINEPINVSEFLLISFLISCEHVWVLAKPIIKAEYFNEELRQVINFCMLYSDQYNRLPTRQQIRAETGIRLEAIEAIEEHVEAWLINEIEAHCRKKALYAALIEGSMKAQTDDSKSTASAIEDNMRAILNMSIHRDIGTEMHNNMKEALIKAQETSGLSCGLTHLDNALDGGFGFKTVNMIAMASGQGKSVWLANMAYNYAKIHKFNVIYISLEIDETMIKKRFASIATGIDVRSTYSKADYIDKELTLRMFGSNKKEGHIYIKQMPMTGTTMNEVESYVLELELRTGLKFQVFIMDYLDLLDPKDKSIRLDNIHMKDKRTCIEFHQFINKKNYIGFTASQRTKGSEDLTEIEQQGSVAGGTEKVNSVDVLIFGRRGDKDKTEGKIRFTIKKTRNSSGDGKIILANFDNNNLIISDVSDEEQQNYHPNINVSGNKKSYDTNKDPIVAQSILKSMAEKIPHRI